MGRGFGSWHRLGQVVVRFCLSFACGPKNITDIECSDIEKELGDIDMIDATTGN